MITIEKPFYLNIEKAILQKIAFFYMPFFICVVFYLFPLSCGNGGTDTSTTNISTMDCGNDMGNGNQIISGPNGPDNEDFDSVFRSLTVHPSDPNIVLMGTERNGFVKSTNGGTTWTRHRSGLRHTLGGSVEGYPEIWDIAFDPSNPLNVYAATLDSPGPVTGTFPSSIAGVYKSTDGGNTWSRTNCGLSNSRITSVRVDPSDSNIIIIGVEGGVASFSSLLGQFFGGGIYRSTDSGVNWSKVDIGDNNDVQNGFWHIIPFGNTAGQFITFGFWSFQNTEMLNSSGHVGFFRSTDSGATWTPFGSSLRTDLITYFGISSDGQTIYANERDSYVMQVSTDGGATWNTTSVNQANGPVAVSPLDTGLVLYAGTKTLYRSTDSLASFQNVLVAGDSINDIAFAPSDPSIVYAVTTGYLIYKSTDSGETFTFMKNIRSDVLNSEEIVHVDFTYTGTELGTESQPYNTLAEAINAVSSGGTVIIKAGTTSETLTIDKNVTIQSSGGTATIGAADVSDISMITPYVNESDIRSIGLFFYDSHRGIDFQVTGNLIPFQAVFSGVVENIKLIQLESTLNWQVELEIRYNSTYSVLYAFEPMTSVQADGEIQLTNILVSVEQAVSQGDIIGYLYAPNLGAHVHFGLFKYVTGGGDPLVCPEPYFTQEARDSILNLIHREYPDTSICN